MQFNINVAIFYYSTLNYGILPPRKKNNVNYNISIHKALCNYFAEGIVIHQDYKSDFVSLCGNVEPHTKKYINK